MIDVVDEYDELSLIEKTPDGTLTLVGVMLLSWEELLKYRLVERTEELVSAIEIVVSELVGMAILCDVILPKDEIGL